MLFIAKNSNIRKREHSDFENRILPHLEYLYRISYRFTGNKEDAEDLVQDLLVKLYPKQDELIEVVNLRSWLIRVLYRQFIDTKRKQKRFKLKVIINRSESENKDPLENIPGSNPDPEEYTQGRYFMKSLKKALDKLNKDQRAVVVLHDIEGYKLNELEMLLEVPQGTLKSRLHRARAKIRNMLKKNGTF